jgi:hypothetical protein
MKLGCRHIKERTNEERKKERKRERERERERERKKECYVMNNRLLADY